MDQMTDWGRGLTAQLVALNRKVDTAQQRVDAAIIEADAILGLLGTIKSWMLAVTIILIANVLLVGLLLRIAMSTQPP